MFIYRINAHTDTMATVFICYAQSYWTIKAITSAMNGTFFDFDDSIDEFIVEQVDELLYTDDTGYQYKIFFIVFNRMNNLLQEKITSLRRDRGDFVYEPLLGERTEKYFKFEKRGNYWNIIPTLVRIQIGKEMAQIEHIKKVDLLMYDEVEYIEEEYFNTYRLKEPSCLKN